MVTSADQALHQAMLNLAVQAMHQAMLNFAVQAMHQVHQLISLVECTVNLHHAVCRACLELG